MSRLYLCIECGEERSECRDLMCKRCAEKNIRVIRLSQRDITMAPDPTFRDLLEPGESVASSYDDEETGERVLIIKRYIN